MQYLYTVVVTGKADTSNWTLVKIPGPKNGIINRLGIYVDTGDIQARLINDPQCSETQASPPAGYPNKDAGLIAPTINQTGTKYEAFAQNWAYMNANANNNALNWDERSGFWMDLKLSSGAKYCIVVTVSLPNIY